MRRKLCESSTNSMNAFDEQFRIEFEYNLYRLFKSICQLENVEKCYSYSTKCGSKIKPEPHVRQRSRVRSFPSDPLEFQSYDFDKIARRKIRFNRMDSLRNSKKSRKMTVFWSFSHILRAQLHQNRMTGM